MGAVHARLADHAVAVVTQRAGFDVEVHVWKSGEEFTIGAGDRIGAVGDLSAGQFHSRGAGFECRERRRDILPILCLEMC
ncbi:MAG TPA: hypothetical protein VLZ05_27595 [Mycobacterium sp.]|nr:hypothetical protein [Mycobacterium sp.]HUH72290.1 hypothetical protein [Mycobacterium sp.]